MFSISPTGDHPHIQHYTIENESVNKLVALVLSTLAGLITYWVTSSPILGLAVGIISYMAKDIIAQIFRWIISYQPPSSHPTTVYVTPSPQKSHVTVVHSQDPPLYQQQPSDANVSTGIQGQRPHQKKSTATPSPTPPQSCPPKTTQQPSSYYGYPQTPQAHPTRTPNGTEVLVSPNGISGQRPKQK
jgi:hypothetical protein